MGRSREQGRPAAPVRLAHLGLGNFFRAHQAWYTEHAPDAGDWGYAAFTGRKPDLAIALSAQDCLYTLITRAADGDSRELISSLSAAHAGADHQAWLGYLRSPGLAAVTITVTEAGYFARPDGGLDVSRPEMAADIAALRADATAPVRTAPARLIAGLAARLQAGQGPIAVIPCDNLPGNGALVRRVLGDLAELIDDDLAAWLEGWVSVVTTMVDRITPRAGPDLVTPGDRCPVVTEPYSDWVLGAGWFPAGRPNWEDAGATVTSDIEPFEERKLWLLNGAHSLLAYAGTIIGHRTVDQAVADPTCLTWLTQWWNEASFHLTQPPGELAAYREALLRRFENARIADDLSRIAADGSQKLPIRVLPVLRAERRFGRLPAGAARIVAAWICHLRGLGAPVNDARADEVMTLADGPLPVAVPRVLGWLGAELADDRELIALVTAESERFGRA